MNFVIAFVATFCMDFVFAAYTLFVQERKVLRSGLMAALIMFFSALAVTSYIHNPELIVPVMLGALCGTSCYVWLEKRRDRCPSRVAQCSDWPGVGASPNAHMQRGCERDRD